MNNCPEVSQRKREQSQLKGLAQERKPFTLGKQTYLRARTTVTRIDPILSLCLHNMGYSLTAIQRAGHSSVFITDAQETKCRVESGLEASIPDSCRNTWYCHWVHLRGHAVMSPAGRELSGLPLWEL